MNNSLLLDTCAAVWLLDGASLSPAAVAAIDESGDRQDFLHVSPYTAWEVGMLASLGRLSLAVSPQQWFRALLSVRLVRLADMTPDILIASSFLPGMPPRDPADRIMIATARELGMTIITRDRLILGYANEGHVRAIAC